MKNIILLSIILLSIGCFSGSKKATKTDIKAPVTLPNNYEAQTLTARIPAANQSVIGGTLNTGIDYNNTRVRIFLDSLISGVAVDTTIVRNNTVTTYSFTPQINFWDKTDTCYSARYFITVDLRQEIAPRAKELLQKRVAEMDKTIQEDNEKLQRKIKARNDALQLSKN
jgi:hypothetical protein